MSTFSRDISGSRLSRLIGTRQTLFHIADLALLWNVRNPNTLRVTLLRAVKNGWLHRVHRGLYSLYPPEEINPPELGAACLHRYCYLSTETVLRDAGLILQNLDCVTFVSSVSRRWEKAGVRFVSRMLRRRHLHHPAGIREEDGVLRATETRAAADMLYFDPRYHFDRPVDWKAVRLLQREIGYPLTPHRYADSPRA